MNRRTICQNSRERRGVCRSTARPMLASCAVTERCSQEILPCFSKLLQEMVLRPSITINKRISRAVLPHKVRPNSRGFSNAQAAAQKNGVPVSARSGRCTWFSSTGSKEGKDRMVLSLHFPTLSKLLKPSFRPRCGGPRSRRGSISQSPSLTGGGGG